MRSIQRRLLVALLLLTPIAPGLAAMPAPAHAEVIALLRALGNSNCEFFRNGSWYDSAKAESHLKRKFDYVERKGLATSADQFIESAASRSSTSGDDYQVRCPGSPPEPSAEWLERKLEQIRARPAKD
jgi:hypothetical protein